MIFHDRALIDGPARITREGHFVANARVAKANNIQDYQPSELGLPPKADGTPYRIFRPESAIFAKDSLKSALHRPIVVDHPKEDVTAENWKSLSVGDTGGEIMRDGETMVVPVMVMDAKAVKAIQTTHPEFSWGYSADLEMIPGKFGDAEYDGSMTAPSYNHLAMCRSARGGHDLRIVDERTIPETKPMKIKIGDAEVDLSDSAAVAVAIGAFNATLADAQKQVGTLTAENAALKTTVEARDGAIVALEQQVKDAVVTPEKLQQLAAARAVIISDAKKIAGDKLVTDGLTDAEIRKAAVTAKLGDEKVKTMADAAIEGAFTAYAAGGATAPKTITGQPVNLGDARTAIASSRAAWLAEKQSAHRSDAA
jgi:hypothetical protein